MSNTALLGSYGAQDSSSLMFRNRIINGGMDVWQRATSASGVGQGNATNAYGYLAADRWWAQAYPGTAGSGTTNISMSRQAFTLGQTAVSGEPSFFMRVNASAVGTQGGSTSIIRTVQRIEDVRTFAGQTATLSFWAKADSNRTYAVCISQVFGTGGSPSTTALAGQATFSVTSSWQYITLTFNIPSISGKTIGTNADSYLDVNFVLYKQDNLTFGDTLGVIGSWSTTPYLDLALAQMEAGPTATPFERRPIGVETQLAMRYYEKGETFAGSFPAGTSHLAVPFQVQKRTNPVITASANTTWTGGATGTAAYTTTGNPASPSPYKFILTNPTANTAIGATWTAEAEL